MKRILVLLVACVFILSVGAVAFAADGPYLGTAIRSLANPYHAAWAKGAEMFAEWADLLEFNVIQTSEGSSEKQLNDIKALIARSGGNVVFSIDPNQSVDALAIAMELEKNEVYFLTFWNKPEEVNVSDFDYWVSHVTFDNRASGYNTAKILFDSIGGEGEVFALQGMLGNAAAIERWEGFQRALEEYPDIVMVDWQTAEWEKVKAYNHVSNALIAHPNIEAVWAANDNMGIGAIEALRAHNLAGTVKVSGVDAIPEMITAIQNGEAVATVSSDAYWQGGMGLAIPLAAMRGEINVLELPENKREWIAESILITEDNIGWYVENYIEGLPVYDWTDYWGRWVRGINE